MKNATVLILFAILILGVMNSCNGGGKQKTLNGFEVNFIEDQKGDLAKEGDYVYFRYHVMYKDSLIFSSNMQSPIVKFKLPKLDTVKDQKKAQPIAEVLHMMSKGDSVIVYQKMDEQMKKSVNLPNVDILDFHVALIDIKSEAEYKKDMEADQKVMEEKGKVLQEQSTAVAEKAKKILEDYKANKLKSTLVTTPSGLKYLVLDAGTGPKTQAGKPVSVNYYGMLMDGNRFDDSYSRGQEFKFPLGQGQVIKGWDEGILNLNEGAKAALFIPANLAYGAEGSPPVIPANSELMFYVEVVKVN